MPYKLWVSIRSVRYRYLAAILLAAAAQVARVPFHLATTLPFITHAPFVLISALLGGLGPGLLTTILCALESVYFSVEPIGSFAVAKTADWRIVAFGVTSVVISLLADGLKRDQAKLSESHSRTSAFLEGMAEGFIALDHEWRYTHVNAAASKILGIVPRQLLGKNFCELWPQALNSPMEAGFRRAVADNVAVQVEAFYAEPLNLWFDVRCCPTPYGLSLFFVETTERKRAEERMRLLESATLQTRDGIVILKVSGTDICSTSPIFANPAFEQMTGFSLEELREGALPLLCSSPENVPTRLEQPIQRKDGSAFWAEWSFGPLAGQDGNYCHCVWTCRDITERKQAEEESMLFSSIVQSSDDAIVSENLDGIILTWNRGAEQIYGYVSREIVGQHISIVVPSDRAFELPLLIDNLRRGEKIERYETERVRKDGGRIFVSLTMSPIKEGEQRIVGVSVTGRDITERKLAERALSLSEERYRSLTLATSQIVWTMDARGEMVEDMPMWREFTGQTREEAAGRGWMNALHDDDRDRMSGLWARALRSRSFYNTEFRMRRHDSEYRYMHVHGVPVLEPDGTIREWVGTCADITDRVQAEEEVRELNEKLEKRVIERTAELEAANAELEAFAYSVSHDLRAPLRAVDGFSRILLEEHAPHLPSKAQHYLQVARNNALQMGDLIDGLLAFSRLGRQPLCKQLVSPAELVRQVLEDLRVEQTGRQVEITVGDLPACEGDPLLLKQVFVNLLSNALKYTRTREVARIDVASMDSTIYYVRDNGVGFDMRFADKLFGVFQRLHRAEEYEGTGAGLAIVQRIIHRHGGRIWAEALENQQATFYFTVGGDSEPRRLHYETLPRKDTEKVNS